MVVYVEYAFLENFLLDFGLLCLAFTATKVPIKGLKICFAAAIGGIFALLYPFLSLPKIGLLLLKTAVALLMCWTAFGWIKNKKDGGRYALSTALFFMFTFAFGGVLTAVYHTFSLSRLSDLAVMIGFALFSLCICILMAKLYQKRAIFAYIYPCKVVINGKTARENGYFDSGNTALKNGVPVCFLSPELFYRLLGNEIVFCTGQVCDEMQITTMTGTRKIPIFKGEIEVEKDGKCGKNKAKREVYFALGTNMIQREYKILLNAGVFEGKNEEWA